MRKARFILIGVLLCLVSGGAVLAQPNYDIDRWVTSGGGGERVASGSYQLVDVTGQTATGHSESASYVLEAGFLFPLTITECIPGDADGNEIIDINDWVKIRMIILGLEDPTCGAYVDEDDDVDVFDWVKVKRIIMGEE